jgi:predicted DNA-binding transcriptional regulator AlpA
MGQIALQLALAATLVAISCLAARRWGEQVAGVTSALPAIAGPFLLLVADEHGVRAAARAANGTLAGLLILSGFVIAYAHTARRHGWPASLAAGWIVAASLAALVALLAPRAPLGLFLAVGSLALAWRLMPSTAQPSQRAVGDGELLLLMTIAALLVFVLAHAVGALGPRIGGALAGLPVIATVLAVNTHRQRGPEASTTLMRGMLEGMAGFVVFCETVALLATVAGIALTFSIATLAALTVQVAVVCLARRPPTVRARLAWPRPTWPVSSIVASGNSIELLKPAEVAASLGVSRTWLYDAAKCGRIPSIRIGGEDGPLRFVAADLRRWIDDARAAWVPGRPAHPTRSASLELVDIIGPPGTRTRSRR